MNEDLEHLIVLQAQDLELERLRGELAATPGRVEAAAVALRVAEAAGQRSASRLLDEEKLRRGHDAEIGTLKAKLERLQRSLDGATSTQQVTAFEHEIGFSRAAIVELEEAEFASLERTELLEAEHSTNSATAERAHAAAVAERERAVELRERHGVTIAGVERERLALRARVVPARLSSYDRLSKARGTAVAEAVGTATAGKCAACQMGVRPQRWQDLIGREYPDEIFTCETCGRMLFWDPRRDMPGAWAPGERFHAAEAGAPAKGGNSR